MYEYQFDLITNNRELENLRNTFGESLNVFRPEFLRADIPLENAFINDQDAKGLLENSTSTTGNDKRILTLHVAVDAIPDGEGAVHVANLIAQIGYDVYKPYMLNYWMSDIPHKIRVTYVIR